MLKVMWKTSKPSQGDGSQARVCGLLDDLDHVHKFFANISCDPNYEFLPDVTVITHHPLSTVKFEVPIASTVPKVGKKKKKVGVNCHSRRQKTH